MNSIVESLVTELVEEFFTRFDIRYKVHDRVDLLLTRYFNFRLKYISEGARKPRVSRELSAKLAAHPARDACFEIFQKTIIGADLNPYQSKGVANADVHDGLFNDWSIHHLHLSTTHARATDYFVARADYLLFVRFTDEVAYFIDIEPHAEPHLWGKKNFIRIIHNNWPHTIADRGTRGRKWNPDLSDEEIATLRRKGYLFGVNVEDTAYLLIGHGQTSSGDNMMAGRMADEVIRWAHKNEELLTVDPARFKEALREALSL